MILIGIMSACQSVPPHKGLVMASAEEYNTSLAKRFWSTPLALAADDTDKSSVRSEIVLNTCRSRAKFSGSDALPLELNVSCVRQSSINSGPSLLMSLRAASTSAWSLNELSPSSCELLLLMLLYRRES